MNRRSFLQETLYLSVAAACARETAAQGTIDPALERYRRLQTAALKSRKLDYTERDVDVAPLRLRAHVIEAGRGEPLLLIHGGNGVACADQSGLRIVSSLIVRGMRTKASTLSLSRTIKQAPLCGPRR